jgi:hypothetical protein
MKKFIVFLKSLFSSRKLFILILIFFIFESSWIAISAAYPQAFDEDFHFGLIKFYTHHLSPILSSQPIGADNFGAVFRDPSFLYQYLFSFPLRIIQLFTNNILVQVIILRLINIFLFLVGIVIFKRLLIKAGISRGLSNVILLLFTLIPIVPQLSAQINYDNLLFPLVGLSLLYSFKIIDGIKKSRIEFRTLGLFTIFNLLAILTKYVYLPILLGIFIFIIIYLFGHKNKMKVINESFFVSFKQERYYFKFSLIITTIVLSLLFIQRDVYNLIRYHNVAPQCSSVLSIDHCRKYGPWEYNRISHSELIKLEHSGHHPIQGIWYFLKQWLYWMWFRLFFAINGPTSSYTNYPPLPLPCAAALGLFFVGVVLFFINIKKILTNNPKIILLLVISSFYIVALFLQGLTTYKYTNVPENMNGRYLIPVLIPLAAIFSLGFSISLKKYTNIKYLLGIIIIALFLNGGGFLTFIERSDDSWVVPNRTVRKLNNTARHITEPIIEHGDKIYYSERWFFN